jgi:hypothetical protein
LQILQFGGVPNCPLGHTFDTFGTQFGAVPEVPEGHFGSPAPL